MSPFLFALVAVFATSFGARDQLLVARLAERLGGAGGAVVAGSLAAIVSAGLMAWAGGAIAALLPPAARTMLVAFALVAAGIELAWQRGDRAPGEPTRSLFAIFLVALARQVGDAARFCVFALAAFGSAWWLAGAGGALGGIAALALGGAMGAQLERMPVRGIRLALAVVLLVAGVIIGLSARNLV